jgi:hypothetical protein
MSPVVVAQPAANKAAAMADRAVMERVESMDVLSVVVILRMSSVFFYRNALICYFIS